MSWPFPERDQGHRPRDLGPYGFGTLRAQTCFMTPTTPPTQATKSQKSAAPEGQWSRRALQAQGWRFGPSRQPSPDRARLEHRGAGQAGGYRRVVPGVLRAEHRRHAHRRGIAPARRRSRDDALALEGGGVDRPPGAGRAGPHPALEASRRRSASSISLRGASGGSSSPPDRARWPIR